MTDTDDRLPRLGLVRNPFPPATTGTGFLTDLSLPDRWEAELRRHIRELADSEGDRALVIEGGYGTGKTFILNWIQAKVLPEYRVKPYFFENPGVAFYDLANRLMRQVGRYEVAKALWEMLCPNSAEVEQRLFSLEFRQWLATLRNRARRDKAIETLTGALKERGLAEDEEILNKIARLVVETGERPYFEYWERHQMRRSRGRSLPEPHCHQGHDGRISDATPQSRVQTFGHCSVRVQKCAEPRSKPPPL